MKAVIVDNAPLFRIDVYIFSSDTRMYTPDGWAWVDHDEGTHPPNPSYTFDKPVWEAIMKEAIGTGSGANDDAVKDARNTRDRLLSMIETEWQSKQLEKT